MAKDWWGFETQLKTWVYLDRTIINNQPKHTDLPLMFVDCKTEQAIKVNRSDWQEPRFVFEGRVPAILPNESLDVLHEFKYKVDAYKALIKPYEIKPKVASIKRETAWMKPYECKPQRQTEKLSPEQIRKEHKTNYSDEAWNEVISYVALMMELEISDQGRCNEHITKARLWHKYPNIRAMNNHGYPRSIEGITPSAYKLVCELIDLKKKSGSPLLESRKY
jgi:hypothetical protein